jgi:signal transduction histidine kinase
MTESGGGPGGPGRWRQLAAELAAGRRTEREDSLVRGLLTGIAAFRWLAWAWMAALLVVNRPELTDDRARPWVAVALVAAALAATATLTVLLWRRPSQLLTLPAVAAEVAIAFALEAGDGIAYNGVDHAQSLSSAWPLAAILSAGVALGAAGGLAAGVTVGAGRLVAEVADPSRWARQDSVSTLSSVVLYALAGGVAGFATARLRAAERRISLAQAREEIARTLHDGVLQTLAIVQRRAGDAGDADTVRLVHDQERELRAYLCGTPTPAGGGGDLGGRLRDAAARFEDRYGGTARVIVAEDLPGLPAPVVEALAGAVGEALANAGKHGAASRVTVYAEPEDGAVFCSVKDDGRGFDPAEVAEGEGLRRSVRGRIAEVGGRVEVDGRPGRGTEVRCWVPA